MFRLKFFRALIYPLLLPRRFLSALALFAGPQVGALLLAGLGGGLMVGLNLLPQHKTRWVIAQEAVTTLLYRGCCGLVAAGLLLSVLGGLLWLGYWLRVSREVAVGNSELPAPTGRLRLFGLGCAGLLVTLLYLVPTGFVDYWCLRGLDFTGLSGSQLAWRAFGSGLATMAAALVTLGAGMLGNLCLLRLATRGPLAALNPLGAYQDLRRGWADYLLGWLLLLVPGTVLLACSSLALSVWLIPLVALVTLPFGCYVSLLSAALLGRYHQVYLATPDAPRCTLRAFWLLPALGVVGMCAAGVSVCTVSCAMLCQRAPEVARQVAQEVAAEARPAAQTPANSPYAAVDAHARAAPPEVEKDVDSLAAYLTKDTRNDSEKARAICIWLADRLTYDHAAVKADKLPDPSPEYSLRTRSAVCEGYARLFVALATKAGMNAEVVVGYARTDPGEDVFKEDIKHAWNAVIIDGKWNLLDPTWADRDDNRSFCEGYFLSPPEKLIFTHFPDESRSQRLAKPLTREEFLEQPQVVGGFFKPGAELKSPYRSRLYAGGTEQFELTLPGADEVVVKQGEERIPLRRQGDRFTGDVTVKAGEAIVFAHFPGSRYYEGMIVYAVR